MIKWVYIYIYIYIYYMNWKSLVQQCKSKVSLDENQDFEIEAYVIKMFIFQAIISIVILSTTTNSTNDH
jgi:hypothetical protein